MTDLKAKTFLVVDDDWFTVQHHIALLEKDGAKVDFMPSLGDAYKHFEQRAQSGNAPFYDLVLIDLHCPPLPAALKPFHAKEGCTGVNVGQALGRYLEDRFAGKQPYAYLSVVPDGRANAGGDEGKRSVIAKMSDTKFLGEVGEVIAKIN